MQRADAAAWYRAIAKTLLPHLRNRPVSFKRYIDDIEGEFFWEKDAPAFTPQWVKRFPVPRREGPPIHYIVINDVRTLTWIAEVGGIELHPFLHRIPNIEVATEVVFDLDPGEGTDLVAHTRLERCAVVRRIARRSTVPPRRHSVTSVLSSSAATGLYSTADTTSRSAALIC